MRMSIDNFQVGDRAEVYDGDTNEWVICRVESIGHQHILGATAVFRPEDGRTMTDGKGQELPVIYGIPAHVFSQLVRGPFA